ncbi:MAG: hypothetical protein CM15mP39_10320 [Synechococcus sp.]|nr:MAG: hypothetical protein CM15mP39_10320 [Synechococcus sp.]
MAPNRLWGWRAGSPVEVNLQRPGPHQPAPGPGPAGQLPVGGPGIEPAGSLPPIVWKTLPSATGERPPIGIPINPFPGRRGLFDLGAAGLEENPGPVLGVMPFWVKGFFPQEKFP